MATRERAGKPKPRGLVADAKTEQLLSTWKEANAREVLAKVDNEEARGEVARLFEQHNVDFIQSSLGTIPITHRSAGLKTDWKAIAMARIPADELEQLIAEHSQPVPAIDVLSAPSGWSAEAKASRT